MAKEQEKSKRVSFDESNRHRSLFSYDGVESDSIPEVEEAPVVKASVGEEEGAEAFEKSHVYLKSERSDFLKRKAKLREYFKRLKVGMIKLDDVPLEYRSLLYKYYGVDPEPKSFNNSGSIVKDSLEVGEDGEEED